MWPDHAGRVGHSNVFQHEIVPLQIHDRAAQLIGRLRSGDLTAAGTECYNSLEAPALEKYPLLALYQGFRITMIDSGYERNVIAMRKGSNSEGDVWGSQAFQIAFCGTSVPGTLACIMLS